MSNKESHIPSIFCSVDSLYATAPVYSVVCGDGWWQTSVIYTRFRLLKFNVHSGIICSLLPSQVRGVLFYRCSTGAFCLPHAVWRTWSISFMKMDHLKATIPSAFAIIPFFWSVVIMCTTRSLCFAHFSEDNDVVCKWYCAISFHRALRPFPQLADYPSR